MSKDAIPNTNVLVVDDFPQNLVATEAMLARPGLTILKAESGEAALELLLEHDIALALFDVRMPGMNGYELAEMMRSNQRTREIPIIFMTASDEEAAPSFRGYQSGAVDFLKKPVHPDILRGKVEVFAQLHAQRVRIAQQVENLRAALQINEMFVAVLGHDLRTPLSAVLYGAEMIHLRSSDEKLTDAARRIHAAGTRMNNMVSQLLDVARLRVSDLTLYPSQACCLEITKRIIEEIEHETAPNRIRVSGTGNMEAWIDVDRIGQVLSNLICNALQHGERGAPVEVHIDGTDNAALRISVCNTGAIAYGLMDRLFMPFTTHDGERRSSSGLGLGLYIVKQFVEAHQGNVSVESSKASGTRFKIVLPRIDGAHTETPNPYPSQFS